MSNTLSGLARRELWVDARDLQSDADPDNPLTAEEYAALLTARGRSKLAENQLVRSFSTVVRTYNPTYVYGEDFFLGDTITVTDERLGVSAAAVVQGMERAVSRGEESLILTLGYGQPTLYDKLKRKTSYQKSRGYLKKQIWKKSSKKAGDQGRLKEGLS